LTLCTKQCHWIHNFALWTDWGRNTPNGTIKGNIEVTNKGDFVSVSKGNKGSSAQGQGVVTTKDGSERANYTFLQGGKTTEEGKQVFRGCAIWSTDSTDKLAFLDNMFSFVTTQGNLSSKDRERVFHLVVKAT
jgi:hypothetical protein